MGQFSWMFADTNNTKALNEGRAGYLICPDNTVLFEDCYDGYGHFAGKDAYDLLADWNRKYMAEHPEYMIPQHGMIIGEDGQYHEPPAERVDSYDWYPFYANLSLSPKEVEDAVKELRGTFFEYRMIGIQMGCYDDQNAKLPFPLKICKDVPARYDFLPSSDGDPNQGWGEIYDHYFSEDDEWDDEE